VKSVNDSNATTERFAYAQWVFERHLHWIGAVETKTAAIVSIDVAMMATLGVAFCELAPGDRPAWAILISLVAGVALALSIGQAAAAVWPQTKGPDTSLIFFGKVAKLSAETYKAQFVNASDTELLEDCVAQIHCNAKIACAKYGRVAASLKLAFISIPFWLMAIWMLVAAQH
jgi:hypothetical protein